ncbi:MAG: zinc-binding dehydrogenase [Propionibacteriales bacterium]|nr:zinc-binding dehydrogenase [Propionibacteriales bacterium]
MLITGASGGVGRYAVQLAHLEGAHVIASIGDPVHDLGLHELGAAEIVIGPAAVDGGVDGVIDNVGGRQLADAYTLLTDGGLIIAVGKASEEPTTIDFEAARVRHDRGGIETFNVQVPLGDDLEQLVRLVDEQRLAISIGWRGDWLRYEQAIDALIGRNVMGKVVLDIHTSA